MKILVVLPRIPFPLDKGDKLRAYYQIRELSRRHDIYLFCLTHSAPQPSQIEALRPFCRDIRIVRLNLLVCYKNVIRNWFLSKSLQMGYWDNKRARRRFKDFEAEVQPDVIYNQMVRTMPLVARSSRPKVMDFQDALSMNTERRMERSRGLWRYILHYEFKMLRSSEYNSFSIFDGLTIISEVDSEAIPHKKNGEITIVPNGVDFDRFSPDKVSVEPSQHYSVVFCGNMAYPPNIDAARFLAQEIMPLVWKQMPSATLLLAGADPKPAVRVLESSHVHVSGRLPDIRTAYASSEVFVAPMRIGSGLQNKLLEAMAMHLPCVSTTLAATPLRATAGEHLLVADSPRQMADHIVSLLQSEQLRHRIADAAHQFVQQHFSWQVAVQPLEQLLNEQLESKQAGQIQE